MTESNVRKDFVMPVAVLTIICLVMAVLLDILRTKYEARRIAR